MADMHCNGVVCTDGILIPDALVDLIDRKDLALILHKEQKNVVLDWRQLHCLPIYGHFL